MDCYCDKIIGYERAVRYHPGARVVEASGLSRWIDTIVRRRPLQESLISRIASWLEDMAKPRRVVMVNKAIHSCMPSRGVNRQRLSMLAQRWLGAPCEDLMLRRELLETLPQRGRREG
jgi:GTP cyclohydrolase I